MSPNRTSVLKFMIIGISRELPLFNFEHLDILWAWIENSSQKLWPFEFLESFRRSISSVSIYYAFESNIRIKSYDHLNFSRASFVQFWASLYIISPNRISVWKVMTILISREFSLFNFERLDILCAWIGHSSEKLWPIEFFKSFRRSISSVSIYYASESNIRIKSYDHLNFSRASFVQFWASRYIISPNRISVWKVMTIWISREFSLFNFEHIPILCAWIRHSSEKLWPFEFVESFCCSISSVSMYYVPKSHIRVKIYDHWNFSRASVVQFGASGYIMRLNWISEWKVITIWICRGHPLFNFKRLDILCPRIRHPFEILWPFNLLGSFRRLISRVSISYVPNRTSVRNVMITWISWKFPLFNFECLDILCAWIGNSNQKLWQLEFLESFHCSILSVSISYVPKLDIREKSYEHWNFSRASDV